MGERCYSDRLNLILQMYLGKEKHRRERAAAEMLVFGTQLPFLEWGGEAITAPSWGGRRDWVLVQRGVAHIIKIMPLVRCEQWNLQ